MPWDDVSESNLWFLKPVTSPVGNGRAVLAEIKLEFQRDSAAASNALGNDGRRVCEK